MYTASVPLSDCAITPTLGPKSLSRGQRYISQFNQLWSVCRTLKALDRETAGLHTPKQAYTNRSATSALYYQACIQAGDPPKICVLLTNIRVTPDSGPAQCISLPAKVPAAVYQGFFHTLDTCGLRAACWHLAL